MAEVKFIVERPEEAYEFPKTQRAEPCVMVLYGASGDLAKRKILPAIYNLARDGFLPENFALVGSSRSLESADVFRRHVRESIERFSRTEFDEGLWDELSGRIFHVRGDPREAGTQQEIRGRIGELDREFGTQGNAMFHVATPPSSMYAIIEQLGANELLERRGGQGLMPWPRVLVEKPFGLDLESARQLNDLLARKLEESQIFRVDHFLAKETVQNIMVFRFGNAVFEPIWNSKYVDHVQITAAETLGMEGRGAFYEEVGVLRDVVQNHLLQVLALCAMEAPVSAVPEAVREEKTKVFRALRLMRGDAAERDAGADVCGAEGAGGQLALAGCAVLHQGGQEAEGGADGGAGAVPGDPVLPVREPVSDDSAQRADAANIAGRGDFAAVCEQGAGGGLPGERGDDGLQLQRVSEAAAGGVRAAAAGLHAGGSDAVCPEGRGGVGVAVH